MTLSIRDVGHGEHEKHLWKTSLPLLDILYPHWVPKRQVNTPIDFLTQSLKKASEAFGWKLLNDANRFLVPEITFGEGVQAVRLLSENMQKGLFSEIVSDKFVKFSHRKDISIGKEILAEMEQFHKPVVVLVANFFSLELIICLPKSVGNKVIWEYASSKVAYGSAQEYVDYLATKKFLPFVGEHIPENQIFNILLNHAYWRPLMTSSPLIKDLYRAVLTSQLVELSKYSNIHELSEGHLIITGEVPLYINDVAVSQLAVVDGLGLAGSWSITVDSHYQFLPLLADERNGSVFTEFSQTESSLWIIPQTKSAKKIVKVINNGAVYQGVYGNLYTYSNHADNHEYQVIVDDVKRDIKLPTVVGVSSVTIDLRAWPVVYGPNTVANSVKVPQWLDRIKRQIKVMK